MSNNTVVHILKLESADYRKLEQNAIMKLFFMLLDISQIRSPPNEVVVIVDVGKLGLKHLSILRPFFIKKFVDFLQDAMPLRLRAMHFINCNYTFEKIFAILKLFMRGELIKNVKTYPPGMDLEKFREECVPASCLPMEYGGDLPKMEELNQRTVEQLRDMKEFFREEENFRRLHLQGEETIQSRS